MPQTAERPSVNAPIQSVCKPWSQTDVQSSATIEAYEESTPEGLQEAQRGRKGVKKAGWH